MNKYIKAILYIILVILLYYNLLYIRELPHQVQPVINTTDTLYDTVTTHHRDTITYSYPVNIEIIKTDTIFTNKGDTITLPTKKLSYRDTITNDMDTIIINDHIKGIFPIRDSLFIDWRKHTPIKTINNTIYKTKKGLFITPQVGVGYGFINNKPDIYAGIGLSYTF